MSMIRRSIVLAVGVLLAGAFGPAPGARADHGDACGCAPRGVRHHRVARYRSGCYEGRHVARFHRRGGSWALLRRYLHRDQGPYVHLHSNRFFLPRWDTCTFARAGGVVRWGEHVCETTDVGPDACSLARAALERTPAVLPFEEHLARGLERFQQGDADGAEADFVAARVLAPDDPRPTYGLLVCAFFDKDHDEAVGHLRRLRELGELRVDDRLATKALFGETNAFADLRKALASYTQWSFHDADAQLVAAWAALADGDEDAARRHLTSVLRFRRGDATARHLVAALDGPSGPAEGPRAGEEAPTTEPAPPPGRGLEDPSARLVKVSSETGPGAR